LSSDEKLALAIQHGDADALRGLVERHHSPLLGYLYRLTNGNRPLADDLAQETFIRVLNGIASYKYPHPVKPWLYAIATNLARDHFKSAAVRRTTTLDAEIELQADDNGYLEANLLDAGEAQAVGQALQLLPDHQREVMILRFYQELSLAEIAAALDISIGTVKSRLCLGLRRLRERLERPVYGEESR
jgi:RNA polymerase sigma-70 factor (ECF subfamily)